MSVEIGKVGDQRCRIEVDDPEHGTDYRYYRETRANILNDHRTRANIFYTSAADLYVDIVWTAGINPLEHALINTIRRYTFEIVCGDNSNSVCDRRK